MVTKSNSGVNEPHVEPLEDHDEFADLDDLAEGLDSMADD